MRKTELMLDRRRQQPQERCRDQRKPDVRDRHHMIVLAVVCVLRGVERGVVDDIRKFALLLKQMVLRP